jgi:diaminopimelate decarboxylase
MEYFHYQNNEMFVESVPLHKIATRYGTPTYVYSRTALEANWQSFNNAFGATPHRICYAVKANSNLAILNILARLGCGFDIVSLGELERVLAAGGDAGKIVFSGVGKKPDEILRALQVGIYCFNVESADELERINTLAIEANITASIALRLNPNIDANTHPYISTGLKENKFGIEFDSALELCKAIKNMTHLRLIGIACHIGSQLTTMEPFIEALTRIRDIAAQITQAGITLTHLDIGGGLGICYQNEKPPSIAEYVKTLCAEIKNLPYQIIIEPGRVLIADTGVLLTRIEYLKHTPHKNFAIVDAAMNDLMRPALYDAWQNILPVNQQQTAEAMCYDVVGPVCETADFLGKNRLLALAPGNLLVIAAAGAYGFSMSSNYNSRPRAAEVMVSGDKDMLIRPRETISELYSSEIMLASD